MLSKAFYRKSSLVLLISLLAAPCFGQFAVNVTVDTPDANPGDGICADAGGNCSLRASIMESNAMPGDNDIYLPIGDYLFTLPGSGEDGSVSGDLDITQNLVITGEDTRLTIIRADSLDRIFDVLPGVTVTLEYMEIWEGLVFAEPGGAIKNQGTLFLHELSIHNSMSEGDDGGLQGGGFGGAIFNTGTIEMNEVTIANCLALGGKGANGVAPGGGSGAGAGPGLGGAVYNDTGGSTTLVNCTISNNIAQGGRGGNGTHHQGSGTVSSAGGAGGGFGGTNGPTNGAGGIGSWGGGGGGGGSLSGAGAAGGFGGGGGGGGANSWGGNAGAAGAAGTFGGAGGQGCCSAGSGGGGGAGLGGAIFDRDGNLVLTNCTFAYNQAIGGNGGSGWFSGPGAAGQGFGGAIFNLDGSDFINNSLFAENSADAGGLSLYGTFDSDAGHNLVQATDVNALLVGTIANNLLDVDPLISPLANNGGNTDTHLLEACDPLSPAIDAGNDAFASLMDQIGQPRSNVSEIGSLEIAAQIVILLPADTTLCIGQSLLLDVSSDNTSFEWNDGSTESTLLVDVEGLYSVVITQNGCSYGDEILVEYNPLESVDLGEDLSLCPGDALLLDAGLPGAEYEWQDGSGLQTFLANAAGSYSVTVTLDYCSATDEIVLEEIAQPDINLGEDFAICDGESTDLSTDVIADDYLWNTAESSSSITVTEAGEYTLEVTIGDCVFSESLVLDVIDIPSFNLGVDLEQCDGDLVNLDVSTEPGTYEWQDGSTGADLQISSSGTYSVLITENGCTGFDEMEIVFYPIPEFELGADQTVCYYSNFQLEVDTDVEGISVEWNTGQNSTIVVPGISGNYQATASADGCAFTDEVNIIFIEPLIFDLGEDRVGCKGQTALLNPQLSEFAFPLTYLWSDDSVDSILIVSQTSSYEIVVETECEVVTDEIHVFFESCGCHIYTPNAFTPDQDGINDYFSIDTECVFESFVWRIFNRDGDTIFESFDPKAIWDGSAFEGEYYVPNDVYVWQIEYVSFTLEGTVAETLMGHVTVIR